VAATAGFTLFIASMPLSVTTRITPEETDTEAHHDHSSQWNFDWTTSEPFDWGFGWFSTELEFH